MIKSILLIIARKLFLVLCNRGVIVILYKLYFLSFHFSSQPNKWVFHSSTFPHPKPNTQERKLNLFYPPTFIFLPHFLFPHFSTISTKWTLRLNFMSPISHKILNPISILKSYGVTYKPRAKTFSILSNFSLFNCQIPWEESKSNMHKETF